ncbi:MAG: alpha/beta hydrolase [Chloroflexi bacterium]|nr:alpha/beta hydrolase [Chloroflexota bacterium]
MSAVVVSEGLIHYEVFGRGRPVVFIHGWLGSWRYWVPAMEELSVQQRAYALDLWGFGDSDKTSAHYNIDAYVKLVKGFLDKLGVVHPTLVGHALGGVVALRFAAENPDWVDQVMAVNVPLLGEAINRPLATFSGSNDALVKLASRRAKFSEVEMEVRKTDVAAVTGTINSAAVSDLRPMLPPLTIPVLLVYGGNDPFIKAPEASWLRYCDDNVRAISLDGAQHFPMLEEQNKFNRLLKEFLNAGDDLSSLELKDEWQRRLR